MIVSSLLYLSEKRVRRKIPIDKLKPIARKFCLSIGKTFKIPADCQFALFYNENDLICKAVNVDNEGILLHRVIFSKEEMSNDVTEYIWCAFELLQLAKLRKEERLIIMENGTIVVSISA